MNEKINNLQVVRALAALLVVYYHADYSLAGLRPFGSFGVDIFFVLSGFIMAGVVARSPRAFVRRRLVRILPPYWSFTILVFGIAAVAPWLVKATDADPVHLIKSLLFVPYRKSNGLIQPTLFLGWTLNCEMFFYACMSLALLLKPRRAALVSSLLVAACVAACAPFRGRSTLATFYSNPILFEFIFGIVGFRVYSSAVMTPSRRPAAAFLAFASSAAMIGLQGSGVELTPAPRMLAYGGLSFLAVVSAALLSKGGWDARPGLLVLIGDASYVLYLVHPYIEAGMTRFLGDRIPSIAPDASLAGVACAVLASTAVAIVIHLYLERPTVAVLSRSLISPRAAGPKPLVLADEAGGAGGGGAAAS